MRLPPRALFRLFPLASRASAWIEHRYTSNGRLLLGLLVAASLFGIDLSQTQSYQLASLALALLLTAYLGSIGWRPRLSIERILPDCVTADVATAYWVEIRNEGTRTERDLVLHDRLNQPPISYLAFQNARRSPAHLPSNRFDRNIGFPRWVELRRRLRGAELPTVTIPVLPPGTKTRIKIDATFLRRGWIAFESIEIKRPDPLGLVFARRRLALPGRLLALPQRHAVPDLHVASQRRYQRGGVSLALAVGDSQEFAGLREYRAGDPLRHIHWRSFAKTGRLIVKEYQDEYFDRHALVVDTYAAPGEEARFEGVIAVAASIASGQRPRDSILDLMFAGTHTIELSAGRGLGDAQKALTYLAEAKSSDALDFQKVGGLLRQRAAQCASVVLVLSRWDSSRQTVVRELLARGTHALALCVVDGEKPAPNTPPGDEVFFLRSTALAEDLLRIRFP